MDLLNITAGLITLAALFSYINARFFKLPATIGIMIISLVISLAMVLAGAYSPPLKKAFSVVHEIDFSKTVMEGMLSFLLFAGALHVNLADLRRQKWVVGILASVGIVLSTFLIGSLMYGVFAMLSVPVPYIYCLVFGALISPTDPIAVLSILKSVGAPKDLETKITGESLFNDGVGVVVFLVILQMATGKLSTTLDLTTVGQIAWLFIQEAVGGVLFGLIIGWVAYRMIKSIDNYHVEILLTLALVMGGYAAAMALHLAAPIAIVVAGLMVGHQARRGAMSQTTEEYVDKFWELIDEVLNAVLFVLIGLEVLVLAFRMNYLMAGLIAIPVVLASRFLTVGIPISIMRLKREFTPRAVRVMTWGGLRGGISVALALSLPRGFERDLILTTTYVVVVFSIIVQGLSIKYLLTGITDKSPSSGGH